MKRREFLALLGGVAAPLTIFDTSFAQQPDRVRRLGVLAGLAENDANIQARFVALRQGLERRGWAEGRNIQIDYRYAPAGTNAHERAKELLSLQPDVVIAHTINVALALQRETRTVPIVFVSIGDPIGPGLIATLARPGGNITGLTTFEPSIAGKWVSMLKEVAPRIKRAGFLANPDVASYGYYLNAAKAPAASLEIELVPCAVKNSDEIRQAVSAIASTPDGALIVVPDVFVVTHSDLIIALAAQHRLPAVYAFGYMVPAGGLMSYGTDRVDEMRQAASYVDRILRGDQPADLPVQAPTKFETFINLRTAKALGLSVPSVLLLAADEVVE